MNQLGLLIESQNDKSEEILGLQYVHAQHFTDEEITAQHRLNEYSSILLPHTHGPSSKRTERFNVESHSELQSKQDLSHKVGAKDGAQQYRTPV